MPLATRESPAIAGSRLVSHEGNRPGLADRTIAMRFNALVGGPGPADRHARRAAVRKPIDHRTLRTSDQGVRRSADGVSDPKPLGATDARGASARWDLPCHEARPSLRRSLGATASLGPVRSSSHFPCIAGVAPGSPANTNRTQSSDSWSHDVHHRHRDRSDDSGRRREPRELVHDSVLAADVRRRN